MTDVALELGPGSIRRLCPDVAAVPDQQTIAVALGGIDDTVVLVNGCPTDVESLWLGVIASLCGPSCDSLTIVHPTWWPKRRVDRIVELARQFTRYPTDVVAVARSRLLAGVSSGADAARPVVVIEIGEALTAISSRVELATVLDRFTGAERIADAAMDAGDPTARFVIDAPAEIPGAENCTASIRKALLTRGVDVVLMCVDEAVERDARSRARTQSDRPATPMVRLVSRRIVAATLLGVAVCGVAVVIARSYPPPSAAGDLDAGGTNLVEGRVMVRIPLHWNIERISAGPGSRRVQVTSPVDRNLALHITQAYAPGVTMGETADVLEGALELAKAAESVDVFRDFNRDGERAGRPAITYREERATREIGWAVVVDGSMRVGIGCQSPSGRWRDIQEACDAAVRSVSELPGTDEGR